MSKRARDLDKLVIVAMHTDILNTLERFISDKLRIAYIRIDQDTPMNRRQDYTITMNRDPLCRVALLHPNAFRTGDLEFRLTGTTVLMYSELIWYGIGMISYRSILIMVILGARWIGVVLNRKSNVCSPTTPLHVL
jgi:hypothetical protein